MAKASVLLSSYLKSDVVKEHGPFQFTINRTEQVQFENKDTGRIEKKWALHVDEDERKVLLNKENTLTLIDQFGDETDYWTGNTVEVFFDKTVTFGGKRVGGIRVRAVPAAS